MRFWPFKKKQKDESEEAKKHIEETRRRQRKVELELQTIVSRTRRGR